MACEFKLTRRVEFHETDLAGIVHHSNFFRYMEAAEHAFFRSLGFSIATHQVEPPVGWPRVRAECDFKSPLRFEDEVEIHLLVEEKKSKALTYRFRLTKLNAPAPRLVAQGRLTVVCVTRNAEGSMTATTIPNEIADKIEAAPAENWE
jgi:YbgC/YbaW family acyl-CoA thioester hydrolase